MRDRAVPNLPSRDFDATAAFYGSFGFETAYRDAGWLILERGTVALEFFPHPDLDPFSSGAMCSIRVADVDELYAAIRATGVAETRVGFPRLHPITREAWGGRVGYLVDIDGTQLNLIGAS
ncbi:MULTISPECIES: bleomycin resistance protein [unclassified Pseudoclavibacter]|uniref:bleomycin resistance protein n=1 Tax=unclassified Pseudoclavibacter TaxID=2615177 RepID=UPI0012EF027F|nr:MULTISPECIES: bleomycin resistance protein [unclassified Pseudoclavibacter]MBF4457451.1 bleomycin resistance protein [Pseudoclavibacter sp. VKM Ac-2867]VXB91651.1 Bleomycin resistance protein [Pseudoclavibacter sp. 8L]